MDETKDRQGHRERLRQLIQDRYNRMLCTYVGHNKAAARKRSRDGRLRWWQIALSGVTTCGVIHVLVTDDWCAKVFSAGCAAAAFILNAYLKEAKLKESALSHEQAANELHPLRERYLSLLADFDVLDEAQITSLRNQLALEVERVYAHAPKVEAGDYEAAVAAIQRGEESFPSLEELQKILPPELLGDAPEERDVR